MISGNEIGAASELLLNIYEQTSPLNEDYKIVSNEMFNFRIELVHFLISFYNAYTINDINSETFEKFIRELDPLIENLFMMKSQYYFTGDKIGQFNMHYLLARIYTETDKWGDIWDLRSAKFQLKYAIDRFEDILKEKPGFYQATP